MDLGSSGVKAVVVDHRRGRPRLAWAGVEPVEPGGVVRGELRRPGALARAVRTLLEGAPSDRAGLVTGVGGRDVVVKLVRIDRVPEEDAPEVIRWEAGQHLRFDVEDVELDHVIVDAGEEGGEMTVLLVAAKKERVRERMAVLEEAGRPPDALDAEPFALHNALAYNHPSSEEGVVGLACIGHERTALNVADRGVPILGRDLAFGAVRLRDRVASDLGVASGEAARLLRRDRAPSAVREAISSEVEVLAAEVTRASSFLEERGDGIGLGRLFLCGGGAAAAGLDELLAERLGLEVHAANPIRSLARLPGALDDVDGGRILPLLLPAVGMALRRVG